jgi:hypothetical protein
MSIRCPASLFALAIACGSSNSQDARQSTGVEPDTPSDPSSAGTVLTPDDQIETLEGQAPDPSLLFDMGRVMEVQLEMDPNDWSTLRNEVRSLFDVLAGDCMAAPATSPYTWFDADLWLDGQPMDPISVRKKGFIGSQSITRPGMKLEFDALVDGRRVHGMERMTLNNTPQDPTMLRNCIAFDYFRRVGVPASRCGFATVTVNGEELGIYATVQPVDDHFLADNGIDRDAPLFEGALSDFRDGWLNTFEPDSETADPALLEPILEAVERGDLASISSVIHIDDFIRFWVAEAMLAHWDGYGWNTNNFYLYIDPEDGLARFIPWGTDATWASQYPGGGLDWIPLNNQVTRTLAAIPEIEALYRAEVDRQRTLAGDPADAIARIDAAARTIEPWHDVPNRVEELKALAQIQLTTMAGSATQPWPTPTAPLRAPLCMAERGRIEYTFEGDWGSVGGTASPGTCNTSYVWDDIEVTLPPGALYAGLQDGYGVVACIHTVGAGGATLMSYNTLPAPDMTPGTTEFDHMIRRSVWYYTDDNLGGAWVDIAWIEGSMVLDEARPDGRVGGSAEGILWNPAW